MKPNRKIFVNCLTLTFFLMAASTSLAGPGNKVTGHYIRVLTPEIAWEMLFNAHEAVVNKKGKIRPAKGMAMGYRIRPDYPDAPMFWKMRVTCVTVFDETYARFAGIVVDHSYPDRIGLPIAFEAFDYADPGNDVDYLRPKQTGQFSETDCPNVPGNCTPYEYAQAFCDGFSDPPEGAWYVTEGNIKVHFD